MTYKDWYDNHAIKHKKIIEKVKHLSTQEIVEYFRFENMVKNEPEFCPLYKDNKKCHDTEKLNCYFCGCPNFRVGEFKSYCDINSKDGGSIEHNGYTHQDCSKCTVPHKEDYVLKHFSLDWTSVMVCKSDHT